MTPNHGKLSLRKAKQRDSDGMLFHEKCDSSDSFTAYRFLSFSLIVSLVSNLRA